MKKTINTILALSILMAGSLAQAIFPEGTSLEKKLAYVNNFLPAIPKVICSQKFPDGTSAESIISIFQYQWLFTPDESNEYTNRELKKLAKKKQLKAIGSTVRTDSDGSKIYFYYNLYFSKFFYTNDVNEYWYDKYTLKTYPYYPIGSNKTAVAVTIEVDSAASTVKETNAEGGSHASSKGCEFINH